MPTYEYRCEKGHTFEVLQRMTDASLTECEVCGAPVQRVFHPVAVHFKGSGFYTTDYGKKKKSGANGKPEGESKSGSADGGAKEPKKESKKADSAAGSKSSGSGD